MDAMKAAVWVVQVEGKQEYMKMSDRFTAFCVDGSGFLLTKANGGWSTWSDLTIRCRPVDFDRFHFLAKICLIRPDLDLCLLRIFKFPKHPNLNNTMSVAEFGDGDLEYGDRLRLISHPAEFVGTIVTGQVCFPCTSDISFDLEASYKCRQYVSSALRVTPMYRVMGHSFHRLLFEANPGCFPFEENLVALIPIIQTSGLVGGAGATGGPLFDLNGLVVGMLVNCADGFDISIHVSALVAFVNYGLALTKEKEERDKTARANANPKPKPPQKKRKGWFLGRASGSRRRIGGC